MSRRSLTHEGAEVPVERIPSDLEPAGKPAFQFEAVREVLRRIPGSPMSDGKNPHSLNLTDYSKLH